jgi:hypothetical protein
MLANPQLHIRVIDGLAGLHQIGDIYGNVVVPALVFVVLLGVCMLRGMLSRRVRRAKHRHIALSRFLYFAEAISPW